MKVGGRYALGAGAVVVDKMTSISLDDITPALARRSGFASLADLMKTAKHGYGERVFVIDFHYDGKTGARPRPETGVVSAEELAELVAPRGDGPALEGRRMDARHVARDRSAARRARGEARPFAPGARATSSSVTCAS